MMPDKLFQQLLVLGSAWRVQTVDYLESESKVVTRDEETSQLWAHQKGPHCEAASVAGYDHSPERNWRHRNVYHEIIGRFRWQTNQPAAGAMMQKHAWAAWR
jgi:hypothetical protein